MSAIETSIANPGIKAWLSEKAASDCLERLMASLHEIIKLLPLLLLSTEHKLRGPWVRS